MGNHVFVYLLSNRGNNKSVQLQRICSGDVTGSICKLFFQMLDLCVIQIDGLYYCDFLLYYNSVIPESWTYDLIIYKQCILAQHDFFVN